LCACVDGTDEPTPKIPDQEVPAYDLVIWRFDEC